MKESSSARRLAENEVIFRKANEAVQKDLHRLYKTAKEEGYDDLYRETEAPLHFYCECADEKCRQRIIMPPSKYTELHNSRTRFVIKHGHQVPEIERVVLKEKQYTVVDKMLTPPANAGKLHPTKLKNTKK
jgi:hypothetical protein